MTSSRTLALAISAVLSASVVSVHAAEGDAGGRTIEEVIVSVERVEQTLQSYEGTAVAMSQAALDTLGASDLLDLPALMPGLEISNYESNTELYVSCRSRGPSTVHSSFSIETIATTTLCSPMALG